MNSARTFLILLAACCIFGYGGYRYAGEKLQKKYDKDLEDMRETLSEQAKEDASLEWKKEAAELDSENRDRHREQIQTLLEFQMKKLKKL